MNALIYVFIDKNNSTIAINLTINLLQLVVAITKDVITKNMLKHLNTIYFFLKKIFNTKFSYKLLDINL